MAEQQIIAITPTGDRPIPFELCRKWMDRQTVKPTKWIIVDDGKEPMAPWDFKEYEFYIRREPQPKDPKHTLVKNVEVALSHFNRGIENTKVLFWEDDEYYSPSYIETIIPHLDSHQVVGISHAKYYHLQTGGYVEHKNTRHASLAETAFHLSVISMIEECVKLGMEKEWLDCNIWSKARLPSKKISHFLFKDNKKLFVGIKGLPGRFGIGIGHKINSYKLHDQPNRPILKEWMGDDHLVYMDLLKEICA